MSSQHKKPSSIDSKQILQDNSNYEPESISAQSIDSSRKSKEMTKKMSQNKWEREQSIKYIVFMHIYHEIFTCKTKRKNLQIFKKLAEYLGTRTARQCRSHFQKLKNRFGTLLKMRNFWKKQLGQPIYEQYYEKISQQLMTPVNIKKQPELPEQKKLVQTVGVQTQEYNPFCQIIYNVDPYQYFNFQIYYQWCNSMLGSQGKKIQTSYDRAE